MARVVKFSNVAHDGNLKKQKNNLTP